MNNPAERECPECGGYMASDRNWVRFKCEDCEHVIPITTGHETNLGPGGDE